MVPATTGPLLLHSSPSTATVGGGWLGWPAGPLQRWIPLPLLRSPSRSPTRWLPQQQRLRQGPRSTLPGRSRAPGRSAQDGARLPWPLASPRLRRGGGEGQRVGGRPPSGARNGARMAWPLPPRRRSGEKKEESSGGGPSPACQSWPCGARQSCVPPTPPIGSTPGPRAAWRPGSCPPPPPPFCPPF
ncbi:salivary acidic proline-rich phosphoprotein 1/2-like [Candoia aspera]|uniref:salivary acidic proline-rich phosphoprotein 1/2-like n=1 Tax=Candoia aspera TaxID=51853 RepID=UPI002FD86029